MTKYKLYLQYILSGILLLIVLGFSANILNSKIFDKFEFITYDWRVKSTLSDKQDTSVVMIDIDEKSLLEQGQWPWKRQKVATLIEKLFAEYGLAALGLDIVFSEPEANMLLDNWDNLVKDVPALAKVTPPQSGDEKFAQVLSQTGVIMGYYFQRLNKEANKITSVGQLPQPLTMLFDSPEQEKNLIVPTPNRYNANLPMLQSNALGAGFFDNPSLDSDGIFRRVPIMQKFSDGNYYPSLPMSLVWNILGQPPVKPIFADSSLSSNLEGFDMGGFFIPTDKYTNVLVPYRGEQGHFPYYSASDILNGKVNPEELMGKIAILGSSAPGVMDLRATPIASIFPGPEINLTLVAAIMQQDFITEPAFTMALELLTLISLGLIMLIFFPRLNAIWILLTSTILISAFIFFALYLWDMKLVIPMTNTLMLLISQTLVHLAMNFWRESSQKKVIAAQFGQYIPPNLVENLVQKGQSLSLEGEAKELTVLFSDVRNFTAFSETCTPTTLTSVMNRLLSPITKAVHDNQGTIDKYMGDAVMAFWGAPVDDENHAQHALEGAMAMQKALEETNDEFAKEGRPELRMGIGIHTGVMNVGNMGSNFRMAYTVMGDNVNLGSRLEGLTKFYGVEIIVSGETASRIPDWLFLPLDLARVKGKKQGVEFMTPINRLDSLKLTDKNMHDNWIEFLNVYRSGNFATANEMLKEQSVLPFLKDLYKKRIDEYLANPPKDFDGIFSHTSK